MAHETQEQIGLRLVNNDPKIPADPDRPKSLVLRPIQLMKTHPRTGGIELKVKSRVFRRLLLVAGEFGEAVVGGAGDAEGHEDIFERKSDLRMELTVAELS